MGRLFMGFVALLFTVASAQAGEAGLGDWLSSVFGADQSSNAHPRYEGRSAYRSGGRGGDYMALASWYGGGPKKYEPNSHTANGERFNKWDLTAAHRSLPFGTRLLVSHGGRSVVVRINDRGPAAWTGRSLDLSKGAAAQLGMIGAGSARVSYSVVGR
jgi:rare lipoprotein A